MNTLFSFYQYDIQNFIINKYCLGYKKYNFDYYYESVIDLKKLNLYYKDGSPCKIIKYNWSYDKEIPYVKNIVLQFENKNTLSNISPNDLYLTCESLKEFYWYFSEE